MNAYSSIKVHPSDITYKGKIKSKRQTCLGMLHITEKQGSPLYGLTPSRLVLTTVGKHYTCPSPNSPGIFPDPYKPEDDLDDYP